jgi:hypothetical protein
MTKIALLAATLLSAAVAMPALAQDDASAKTQVKQPAKHEIMKTMRHHATLRSSSQLGRAGEARAQILGTGSQSSGDANAVTVTSMAQDYGRAFTYSGYGSNPICQPGSTITLQDGPHRCQ